MDTVISKRMAELLEENGHLTTAMVLAEASDPESPLYKEFEWDNSKAALAHRKWQARRLIKRYSVTITKTDEKIVHVPSVKVTQPGEYHKVRTVVRQESKFARAMAEAQHKLKSAREAVNLLKEAAEVEGKQSNNALLAVIIQSLDTANGAISKMN